MKTFRFELYRLTRRLYKRGLTEATPCPYTGELFDHTMLGVAQRQLDEAKSRDRLQDKVLCKRACEAAQRHLAGIFRDFEYPRLYRNHLGHLLLDIPVKTSRAPGGCYEDDCCGTEWPTEDQTHAAFDLAQELGLGAVHYEPCEKGWGDYFYEVRS